MRVYFYLIIILHFFSVFTHANEIVPSPSLYRAIESGKCDSVFLTEIVTEVFLKEGNRVWAGYLDELRAILLASGVPQEKISVIENRIRFLQSIDHNDVVAQDVLKMFDSSAQNPKLAICMADGGCHFQDPISIAFFGSNPKNFTEGHHSYLASLSPSELHELFDEFYGREFGVVVLRKPDTKPTIRASQSVVDWLEALFHELTHSREMVLLQDWVEANQKLRAHGKQVDALYARYVIEREGMTFLDSAFSTVWGESRAHRVGLYLSLYGLGTARDRASQMTNRQAQIIRLLRIEDKRNAKVIKDLDMNARNFFTRGTEITLQIQSTIETARLLP